MQSSKRPRWSRFTTLLVFACIIICAVTVGAGMYVWSTLIKPTDSGACSLKIARGEPTMLVLRQLADARLVPSVFAGRLYLEIQGRGRSPHWGEYEFEANPRPIDVLEIILEGRVKTFSITILEGTNSEQIGAQLTTMGLTGADSWNDIVKNTAWISTVAPEAESLEGFLFPDTYTFSYGTDAATVAKEMVNRFLQVWAEETSEVEPFLVSPIDTVTLASLVEAETSVPEERPRVAGVFTNRLERGMLLQCDPTVVFALQKRGEWSGKLLRIHWQVDDLYNTYLHPGLPPGPINNPGRAALAAAIAPETHTFLYFVAQAGGGHSFSRTLKEHNRAVAQLRRSRH